MPETRAQVQREVPQDEEEIEPYKLSEVFSIVPEFEGDQISLGTFLNACDCAYKMASRDQRLLLTIHIKNKLKGRAAQLINSRNPDTYHEIKQLLNQHFGDSRDLTALIQDLQRLRQLPGESALTFYNRLQVLNAKMLASVHKSSNFTNDQKAAQINLIETMALNTLLTGLEPRLGQIIRAGDPINLVDAHSRIRRELQLSYFETQKTNRPSITRPPQTQPLRKPPSQPFKCFNCGRTGHSAAECRSSQTPRPNNFQNPSPNYQRPNFSQNQTPTSFQQRPFNNNNQRQFPMNQPNRMIPNQSTFQRNPNYSTNQPRAHHLNYDPLSYETSDYQDDTYQNPDLFDNTNYQTDHTQDYIEYPDAPIDIENYQNFLSLPDQNHPPNENQSADPIADLQTQIQTLNLDNLDPDLNFPEQAFL